MSEAVYQCTRCFGIHAVDLTHQPCTADAPKQKLHTDKLAAYLQQENEVLHAKVRQLEAEKQEGMKLCKDCKHYIVQPPRYPTEEFHWCRALDGQPNPITGLAIENLLTSEARLSSACGWHEAKLWEPKEP